MTCARSLPASKTPAMSEPVVVTPSSKLRAYYDKLFRDGYLVSVHISKWGMGAQLSESDLNLENVPKIFRLGKKMLIDPEHLNVFLRFEGKARRYLYSNSYPFPGVSEAHFVPRKKLMEVFGKLKEFKAEFEKKVADFLENYDKYKAEVVDDPRHAAFKEGLLGLYPSPDVLRGKFSFTYSAYELSMPREFGEVDAKTIAEREIAVEEAVQEAQQAIEKELEEQYQQGLRRVEQFANEALLALRSQVVTTCRNIATKINEDEPINKANLKSIREQIQAFRSLNFLDDRVLSEEIDKLEEVVNSGRDFKSNEEALNELQTTLKGVLKSATDKVSQNQVVENYFRRIEID